MKNLQVLHQFIRVFSAALRTRFAPKIEHLILYPSGICNLKCPHCFASEYNKNNELSLQEIRKIAEVIPNPIWLDIGGGEPFLREDLPEICNLFNAERITIPTNGWLTGKILKAVKRLVVQGPEKINIIISLDGFRKTHDSIRGEGSFDRAIMTFEALKKIKGVRVAFSTVLSNRNENEIIDFIKETKKYEPDFHGIILLRGMPRDSNLSLPSFEKLCQIEKEFYYLFRLMKFGGGLRAVVERNFVSYRRHIALRVLKEKKQILPCLAGQSHLVIFPNGDVHPCELLPPVGNIRTSSLSEILKSEILKRSIIKIHSGACYCTHECNMLDNILLNPLCYFNLLRQKKWQI